MIDTTTWLYTINSDVARSLEEVLEEALTVTKLGLFGHLKGIFSGTNATVSMFSRVRDVTRRVKC